MRVFVAEFHPARRAGRVPEFPRAGTTRALERIAGVVLFTGSADDAPLVARLAECLRGEKDVHAVAGRFNLAQHVALVSLAAGVVTMDSSTAHIAGALGIPAVVIIGGGQFGEFGPWGESPTFRWVTNRLPCFNCHWRCIYDRPVCVQDIPPQMVAESLLDVLSISG